IFIDGGLDDDTIEVRGKVGSVVHGGAGNDNIKGGDGNDVLLGETGNDTIDGRKGSDVIVGGLGIDRLSGGDGVDVLISGQLSDQFFSDAILYYHASSREDALRKLADDWATAMAASADLTDGNADGDVIADDATDTLTGGSGADWFIIGQGDKI